MSKKSFKNGFDSLLGGAIDTEIKEDKNYEKEVRATFIVNVEQLDKMKAIAYWDRKSIKKVINLAFEDFLEKYEKANGAIQLPK